MKTKKFLVYFLSLFASVVFLFYVGFISQKNDAFAQFSCPSQTTFNSQTRTATLVGEIQNNGGDPDMQVWFEWGPTPSLGQTTPAQSVNASQLPFRFCATISNLQPCTTYYYRAVGRNSGGTTFGSTFSFQISCPQVSVDIKANGSDGPLTINYGDPLTISWTSSNAQSCSASGNAPNWSGSKPTSGSQSFSNLTVGTYTFTLTCFGFSNISSQDSVSVTVRARAPSVVTLPAVETL